MSYRHYNTDRRIPVVLITYDGLKAIHWVSESYAYESFFRIVCQSRGASFNSSAAADWDVAFREYRFVGMMQHDLFPCKLQVFEEVKD